MDNCVICGKKVSFFNRGGIGREFYGEFICYSCIYKAGAQNRHFSSSQEAIEFIKKRIQDLQMFQKMFQITRRVEHYIEIDDNNKLVKISGDIFKLSDVLSYDFTVDGKTIKKGGGAVAVSNAIIGYTLLGGVGAIAGVAMGLPKNKEKCTSMYITVRVAECIEEPKINFVSFPVKVEGYMYQGALYYAQECCIMLDDIIRKNNQKNIKN